MAVIAIDLGTTVCKAAVFEGPTQLAITRRYYGSSTPAEGWAEQDAEAVWGAVEALAGEALRKARHPRIQAICVSVQGDAIIPIDIRGVALHPAILGMDTRSHAEAAGLQAHFGRGQLYSATGMPCEPLNSITKVCWLIRNHPELLRMLWKFVHYEEFLLMKLAGVPALDFTMASRTMAFDPVKKDWLADILEYVGVRPSQLGNVCPSGVPVGIVNRDIAERWGIDRNALVIAGGHDQCMAAVGAGIIEPQLACYSMGTAEVIGTCFAAPRMTAAMLDANYPCYCHAAADHYFTITLNQSGGLSLDWFHRNVCAHQNLSDAAYDRLWTDAMDGLSLEPSPVLFLPHLVGGGTPTCDHLSRAAFIGMSLKTSQQDLFQAVADALCFEARLNLETLESLGIRISELRAVGGGARSRRMIELKATVLDKPISTLKTADAALLGASMLAHVAVGAYASLEAAVDECVALESTVEPRSRSVPAYEEAFERYRQIYGMLKGFYHHWSAPCTAMTAV